MRYNPATEDPTRPHDIDSLALADDAPSAPPIPYHGHTLTVAIGRGDQAAGNYLNERRWQAFISDVAWLVMDFELVTDAADIVRISGMAETVPWGNEETRLWIITPSPTLSDEELSAAVDTLVRDLHSYAVTYSQDAIAVTAGLTTLITQ